MATSKLPIHDGVPEAEIEELGKRYERIRLHVQRLNAKGHFQTMPGRVDIATAGLYEMEDWLFQFGGGGDYLVTAKDLDNYRNDLLRFKISLEGQPHPPRMWGNSESPSLETRPTPMTNPRAPAAVLPDGVGPMSAWVQGLPEEERIAFMSKVPGFYGAPGPAPGATRSSDEIAINELTEAKGMARALQVQLDAMREKFEAETSRLRDDLAAERAQKQAAEHQAQMTALRSELATLRDALSENRSRPVEPPKPWLDPQLMTALAPVLAAFVTSRSSGASEQLKVHSENLNALMQATLSQANKQDSTIQLLSTLGPLFVPLIQQLMSQKDPDKQAALYEAMNANNLNSISMMTQMIQAMAEMQGDERPWWAPALQQVGDGLVNVLQAYQQAGGGLPGQRPALPQPHQPIGTVQAAARVHVAEPQPVPGDVPRQVSPQLAGLLGLLPEPFQSEEWRGLLQALHFQPPVPPEQMAAALAGQLEDCIEHHTLPPQFGTEEEFLADPQARLLGLLELLPVGQMQPQWAMRVVELCVRALIDDEFVEEGNEEPDSGEIEAQGEEVPKPIREALTTKVPERQVVSTGT